MEHMTLEQTVARTRALMTEKVEDNEPVAVAAGRHRVLPHVPVPQSLCQRLSAAREQIPKSAPGDMLVSVPTTRTCRIEVSGK